MSERGQARLGATASVASRTRVNRGAAESDTRDHHGAGTRPAEPVDDGHLTFEWAVDNVFQNATEVLLKKHADYGPRNISESPGGALNGLRVRMWDKFARINHLIDSGATPENESLRDSFLDMMNYAAIAQLVLDGDWPES